MKNNNTLSIIIIVIIVLVLGVVFLGKKDSGTTPRTQDAVACAQDVKQCSDGSYVARVAPSCEFAACPQAKTTTVKRTPKTVTVAFTDKGFVPQSVTINKDDTIKFVNQTSRPMWPASDPHPAHTIYPEFDAKARLITGQTYSFTFTKTGTWKFHNHSNAIFTGTVVVK